MNLKKSALLLLPLVLTLAGCGASSSVDTSGLSQKSSFISADVDIQIVGSMKGESTFANWDPVHPADRQLFTKVTKEEYTLTGITLAVNDEFKFTFNHGWNSDFGVKGIDVANCSATVITNLGLPAEMPNDDSNIKVAVAGTYSFTYHPLYVASASYKNYMVITVA